MISARPSSHLNGPTVPGISSEKAVVYPFSVSLFTRLRFQDNIVRGSMISYNHIYSTMQVL
jgi:hypothetical protein